LASDRYERWLASDDARVRWRRGPRRIDAWLSSMAQLVRALQSLASTNATAVGIAGVGREEILDAAEADARTARVLARSPVLRLPSGDRDFATIPGSSALWLMIQPAIRIEQRITLSPDQTRWITVEDEDLPNPPE
jgi:hypothetical protein